MKKIMIALIMLVIFSGVVIADDVSYAETEYHWYQNILD